MILVEGKNSDAFYIISKGTVDVILPRPNQSDVIAVQLGPGKYFGEMEFFHDRRSRASIRACETCPVEVLALDYETLSRLLSESEPTRGSAAPRRRPTRRGKRRTARSEQ